MSLASHGRVRSWTEGRVLHSDFDATSMLCFGEKQFLLSRIENCIAVIFVDYTHEDRFLSVAGSDLSLDGFGAIRDYCAQEGLGSHLHLVPEGLAREMAGVSGVRVEWDRDNSDYFYDLRDIARLDVPALRRRRRAVKAFIIRHGGCTVEEVFSFSEVLAAAEVLYSENDSDVPEIEASALWTLMRHWEVIRPLTYVLRDGERVIGLFIAEITHDQAIVHFSRTKRTYPGSASFLLREVSANLARKNAKILNFEQDMGDEGLREYKLSWKPVSFANKATVRWS